MPYFVWSEQVSHVFFVFYMHHIFVFDEIPYKFHGGGVLRT